MQLKAVAGARLHVGGSVFRVPFPVTNYNLCVISRHRTLGWRDAALCTVTGACLLKDGKFAKKGAFSDFFFSTDASYDRGKSSKGLLTRSFALLVIVMHPTANNFQFMRVSHNNSQLIRNGGLAGKRLSYKQLIFQPITINFNLNFQHVAAAAAVCDM